DDTEASDKEDQEQPNDPPVRHHRAVPHVKALAEEREVANGVAIDRKSDLDQQGNQSSCPREPARDNFCESDKTRKEDRDHNQRQPSITGEAREMIEAVSGESCLDRIRLHAHGPQTRREIDKPEEPRNLAPETCEEI